MNIPYIKMKRIKFEKRSQREFLKLVLERTNCPSLRELINRGFEIPYSTLKNYFSELRNLPEDLFNDLCYFAKIDKNKLHINILESNWGQVKGGKKIKRNN